MPRVLLLICTVLILAADRGRADVLVLLNGDRLEGEVVREDADQVQLRQPFGGGKIHYTKSIRKSLIARIEKTEVAASEPASMPASMPASAPSGDAIPRRAMMDKPALLRLALARYQRKDYAGAGLHVSALILQATPAELQAFSEEVKVKVSLSLAELAAESHFLAATANVRGRPVHFLYITDYEKPVFIPRIVTAYEEAIAQDVAPVRERTPQRATRERSTRRGREREDDDRDDRAEGAEKEPQGAMPEANTASRPANSIAVWLSKPSEYNGEGPQAAALLGQIHYATSLLTERQRLDPAAKSDARIRDKLNADKVQLNLLQRAVAARTTTAAGRRQLSPVERQNLIDEFKKRNFGPTSRPVSQ